MLDHLPLDWEKNFNSRLIEGQGVVITNDFGQWNFLSVAEHKQVENHHIALPLFASLRSKGLIRTSDNEHIISTLREKWAAHTDSNQQLIIVHLTQRCNLTCNYCHSSTIPVNATGRDLSLERADKICSFVARSPKKYISIAFQGGEPSLELNMIRRICRTLRETECKTGKEIKFVITTNGTNHTDEFLGLIAQYNISTTVSFDGPKRIHDLYRKDYEGDGSFRKALKFRQLLSERAPHCNSGTIMVLTRDSIPYIQEIVDLYLSFGKTIFRLKPVTRLGRAKGSKRWNNLSISFEEFWTAYLTTSDMLKKYYEQKRTIAIEHDSFFFLRKLLEGRNVGDVDTRNPCGIAKDVLSIDIDGMIYACHESKRIKDFRLGSVDSDPETIQQSPKAQDIQKHTQLENNVHCSRCAYLPFCTPCPAHNYQTFQNAAVRPYESWECKKTLSVGDYILGDFAKHHRYYLDVWKVHRLNETIGDLSG